MDSDLVKTKQLVKNELAAYLGVEAEDIEDDSVLTEDLHMKATDLTDFMEILARLNYDTLNVDLTETETFEDLIEALTDKQ
jgi:hypothetical protein